MKKEFKISNVNYAKTAVMYGIILILGAVLFFSLLKFNLWTVISLPDKLFIGFAFIIILILFGTKYKE